VKKFDLLIKGGQVVLESGIQKVNIAIKSEKIAGIFSPDISIDSEELVNLDNEIVLPGVIDTHAHVTNREDFKYGTLTASKGGVTTIIEMPLSTNLPNLTNVDAFDERVKAGEAEAYTDFALWAGVLPQDMNKIVKLYQLGCTSFKIFMNFAQDDYPFYDDYHLLKLMEEVSKINGLIGIHAENESICKNLTNIYKGENRGPEYHTKSRPPIAELEAINRAVFFAKETGCRVHICHVSIPEGVELIEKARQEGANITIETCPHYLYLDENDIERCGGFAKCNPPLRDRKRVERLWKYVSMGFIDTIGSDHCAYQEKEKDVNIWDAPGGFPGMDLILPILISEGVNKRDIGWNRIAEITSTNASKTFGLYPRKGSIRIGSDADFAIVDPECEWTFLAKDTYYKNKSSKYPCVGKTFKGKVRMTIVRGNIVYKDGNVLAEPGYGSYIAAIHNK
jgi:allantoinase